MSYGLTIIEWEFAGLATTLRVIYFIVKNPLKFIGFQVAIALLVVMYAMGH